MMNTQFPAERQVVEVRFNGHDWQLATYLHGEFIDVFGLPLDRDRITGWRESERTLPELAPRHRGWTMP